MLSQHKNPGTLAAEIKMHRKAHGGAFLVVEGTDDVRFWTRRCHETCEVIDGEGKQNVAKGIGRLDGQSFSGALGVVDDDYDSLLGVRYESRNLVATDSHDLECLLCRSSALDRVLAEFSSRKRIQAFEERTGSDVRTGLLDRTVVFGRVRWAVARFRLDVGDGSVLRYEKFLNRKKWEVDEDGLMEEFDGVARRNGMARIREALAELNHADPWRVAHGHDMIGILHAGLRSVLGDVPAGIGKDGIAAVLRAGISREELLDTGLCRDMRAWEHENTDFPVLP